MIIFIYYCCTNKLIMSSFIIGFSVKHYVDHKLDAKYLRDPDGGINVLKEESRIRSSWSDCSHRNKEFSNRRIQHKSIQNAKGYIWYSLVIHDWQHGVEKAALNCEAACERLQLFYVETRTFCLSPELGC